MTRGSQEPNLVFPLGTVFRYLFIEWCSDFMNITAANQLYVNVYHIVQCLGFEKWAFKSKLNN